METVVKWTPLKVGHLHFQIYHNWEIVKITDPFWHGRISPFLTLQCLLSHRSKVNNLDILFLRFPASTTGGKVVTNWWHLTQLSQVFYHVKLHAQLHELVTNWWLTGDWFTTGDGLLGCTQFQTRNWPAPKVKQYDWLYSSCIANVLIVSHSFPVLMGSKGCGITCIAPSLRSC